MRHVINICAKFEVSSCTRYEDMTGGAKCTKCGGFDGQGSLKVIANVTIR